RNQMLPHSFRYLVLSVFSFVVLLGIASPANACTCGSQPTVLEAFETADEVVILRASSVEKAQDTEKKNYINCVRSATMVVEKVFKGRLQLMDEIVFRQGGGGDCLWTFSEEFVGRQFLFYLDRPEKRRDASNWNSDDPGLWFAFGCGRSNEFAGAA